MNTSAKQSPDANTPEAAPTARPLPMVQPNNVKENIAGACWREMSVRLPQDATFGDLNDPRIWKQVQATARCSLRKLDHLVIIAYDESWLARCVVTEATAVGISTSKPVKTEMPGASQKLFETADYKMEWNGAGYLIVRKSDGTVLTDTVATPEQAERLLWARYPKKAA